MKPDPTQFFSRHHAAYRTSASHRAGADLARLIERLALPPASDILDAATGTGHTAIKLASFGHRVTGVDITPEMLAEARTLAARSHVSCGWLLGDVSRLPFPDASFDAVTCRRAAHHFPDVRAFLREAFRLIRPGGRLGLADMTAPETAIGALNELETLRDPSHVRALTPAQWKSALEASDFTILTMENTVERLPPEDWLAPVAADTAAGRRVLALLRQAPREIWQAGAFWKHRLIIVAIKPV